MQILFSYLCTTVAFLFMVTMSNINIHTMDWKLVPEYFVHTGYSVSICLQKALTIICLCSMLPIYLQELYSRLFYPILLCRFIVNMLCRHIFAIFVSIMIISTCIKEHVSCNVHSLFKVLLSSLSLNSLLSEKKIFN